MVFPSAAAPKSCPCGTGLDYRTCCGPLHDGEPAVTALELMRSRYSAYALGQVDHLFRTWHPRTRPAHVSAGSGSTWLGLEIVGTVDGGDTADTGTVEFLAHSRDPGGVHVMHETSRFVRRAGRWVYVDAR